MAQGKEGRTEKKGAAEEMGVDSGKNMGAAEK